MSTFDDFKIKKQLRNALEELGIKKPTPIQEESFGPIMAGSDFVGIAQTGTGKTFAYLLPLLQELKFSEEPNPRIVILAPTRELVIQIVKQIEKLSTYITLRVVGVFGGSSNIKAQKRAVAEGIDIVVGTPQRLYDLTLSNTLRLKNVRKLVIDEVDIMLDFGYKTQLDKIFNYLPQKRQNIFFSATMTNYVDELISDFLINPVKKTMAVSGTPLENISQESYNVHNFYTKANLLYHLMEDKEQHEKVIVFVDSKINADRILEDYDYPSEMAVIHSGKEQNNRTNSIEEFTKGEKRILVATDVIARGIDIDNISTVVSFNTPAYPENYIHRIGRTGRAGQKGKAILFSTEKEQENKAAIESLMDYQIPLTTLPEEVEVIARLTPEEKDKPVEHVELSEKNKQKVIEPGAAFHEKSEKNSKEKQKKKSYEQQLKERYKKPIRRGDKIQNMKSKKKKRR